MARSVEASGAGAPATAPPLRLSDLNTMDEEAFAAALGGVFEHSPWLARAAWRHRPFTRLSALHAAFEDAMRAAPRDRQIALIAAHPELAGAEADAGELTDESAREQATAALDRLSPPEHAELTRLNRDYRERFGFPLVVCVREHTKESILAWGRARLERSAEQELATALGEIAKIAHLRLGDLVCEDPA
jgi:2-oxo-4-hydroxy-4-carboxy-5-ureidoimidazoline decarboxylase